MLHSVLHLPLCWSFPRASETDIVGKFDSKFILFSDREKAVEMCRQLVERNFGHSLEKGKQTEFRDDDSIYRLLEDDESTALNSGMSSDCEPRPAPQVAEELRRLILGLYNQFLSKDGKVKVMFYDYTTPAALIRGQCLLTFSPKCSAESRAGLIQAATIVMLIATFFFCWSIQGVDYNGMAHSNEFGAYIKHTAELQRVKLEGMTREETLAFFINIYNALVIHANVVRGPPVNLWQRYKVRIQIIISNYWIRLSVIWKIMQIKEGVRPWGITPSEISVILHIIRKPNAIIVLLFIQSIS